MDYTTKGSSVFINGGNALKSVTLSEVISPQGEPIYPLHRLRLYNKYYNVSEDNFKHHLLRRNLKPDYIENIIQKLFHPTAEDLKTKENLKLF